MAGLITLVFIGLVVLINAWLSKKKSESEDEGTRRAEGGRKYEASGKQVQDFLDQVKQRREEAEREQSQRRSQPARASVEQTSAQWTREEEEEQKEEKEAAETSRKPPRRPKKSGKMKRKKPPARRGKTPRTGKVRPTTGSRARYAPRVSSMPRYGESPQRAGFSVRREDLTNAVIWSEILRPPVSLRGEIGHEPSE